MRASGLIVRAGGGASYEGVGWSEKRRGDYRVYSTIYTMTASSDGVVSLAQAALARREREALEAIRTDICEWLGALLAVEVKGEMLMTCLDTGVVLCQLAALIQRQRKAKAGGEEEEEGPFHAPSFNTKADRASFFARDNVANFLSWCRQLGIREEWLFESSGLVEHRDERRVVLCLLELGRLAARLGLQPPKLVQMEKEIEALEKLGPELTPPSPPPTEEEPAAPAQEEVKEHTLPSAKVAVEEEDEQGPPPKKRRREGYVKVSPSNRKTGETDLEEKVSGCGWRCGHHALVVCAGVGAAEAVPVPGGARGGQVRWRKVYDGKAAKENHLLCQGQCSCLSNRDCVSKDSLFQVLSDRVMVRVGGGWDSLEHFLLKHDPCRLQAITGTAIALLSDSL